MKKNGVIIFITAIALTLFVSAAFAKNLDHPVNTENKMQTEVKKKKILLRGSWQTINIGDIAHTPGFLSLAKEYLPEAEVWLWPGRLDRGVREMLLKNYPGLRIVETEREVHEAFEQCVMLVHGSAPNVQVAAIRLWRKFSDKPYVIYGVTADKLWTPEKKEVLSHAAAVYCRDSLTLHFLKAQELQCKTLDFAPDSTFGMKIKSDDKAALRFLEQNQLEPGKYVCVIPRLRWTPASFDSKGFYYQDPDKELAMRTHVESDMEKLREAICFIVRKTGLKVVLCPEMVYQVEVGKRYVYDRLPEDVKAKTVWKSEYWITDEAAGVYSRAHSLLSMDQHSPIMFITMGLPAVLLRQAEDTWKGQMWRDIGLQKWIFELNVTPASDICECMQKIVSDYPAALRQAEYAKECARQASEKAMRHIGELLRQLK